VVLRLLTNLTCAEDLVCPVYFSVDEKSQKTATAENFLRVNPTWRQLEGLEQDLEKLSIHVQTMKENLTNTTDNTLKLSEFSGSTI